MELLLGQKDGEESMYAMHKQLTLSFSGLNNFCAIKIIHL